MKLRDSFISIQHISNELNIPLASIECATRSNEIFPSDYEMTDNGKIPVESDMPHEKTIIDSNIKIIDKTTKTSKGNGMRVRNLKKSMLNDNKLLRLRDKLLRRSKSTVGLSVRAEPSANASAMHAGDTKEEFQNKENEQPKHNSIDSIRPQMPQTSPKVTSPNRNLVKMGTRVFSSQLLNKSYDNIFDPANMDVYHFDDEYDDDDRIMSAIHGKHSHGRSKSHCTKRNTIDANDDGTTDSSANGKKYLSSSTDAERLSLRSTSLSSLYFSEKMSERLCDSPAPNEAYVIRKCTISNGK